MNRIVHRATVCLLVFLLSVAAEPLIAQEQQTSQPAQNTTQPPIELPENPGRSSTPAPNTAAPAPQNNVPPAPQPSGTAVAPEVQASGITASRPAGVAIAPPKQRQIRTWLIRFGFIAGAGVALGTVAALSAASPSRVPNAPSH
jgi:FtsZ-interacting cell division protein ZipA